MDGTPYRLKFGMHKNKTLQEIPESYRHWLIRDKVYADKEDLRAALIVGNYLSRDSPNPYTPPSTPSRKRRLTDDDVEVSLPPSSRRKLAISSAAKRNGTMLNYDGSAYILDFGQHAGKKLDDVPQSYIRWLIDEGVPDKRPDLAAALREQGVRREGGRLLFPGASTAITASQSAWRAPGIYETDDVRFHDPQRRYPRWISDAEAFWYFGLEGCLLTAHGSSPASEHDLMPSTRLRSTEWRELGGEAKTPKRWLYQVYTCAKRFGTVPFERGTADEALKDFLTKNQARQEEI